MSYTIFSLISLSFVFTPTESVSNNSFYKASNSCSICINEEIERKEYARYAHRYFLENAKNEIAGTSGDKESTLWIFSPKCSATYLDNIVLKYGKNIRLLGFKKIECWERKANTPPFYLYL